LVNDYSREGNNSINGLSYDDKSFEQFRITNSVLEIVPKPNGYYFETGFCSQIRQAWSGVEIEMTARDNTEFMVNFQTNPLCNSRYRNNYAFSKDLNPKFNSEGRTIVRFPFPTSPGNTGQELSSFSMEHFAPFGQTIKIFSIRLICTPITERVVFTDTKPSQSSDITLTITFSFVGFLIYLL
jgi:hypothetical protein